jgi:rhomboid protease GluP
VKFRKTIHPRADSWYFFCVDQTGLSRIPARNRRQTMDWGLVLLSQGIAATIDEDADGAGWGLLVSTAEYPAAMRALRLYRLENRHWHWRQPLSSSGFLFDWNACFWAALLIGFYFLSHTFRPEFQIAGRMDSSAVRAGEWWRLFTAILLHADIAHLVSNVSLGLVLLGLTMGRFGGGPGLLATYLAGAAGNVAGLLIYPNQHFGVGASGMVMGGLGMLAAQSVTLLRRNPISRKYVLRALMAGAMLFALFGLSPETDVVAHFFGFASGILFGAVLLRLPPRWLNAKIHWGAGLLLFSLAAITVWLAVNQR